MVNQYDLYDISYALMLIRNDIKNVNNKNVLSQIIYALDDTVSEIKDNKIRKALATINDIDSERWYFVYHNNVYVNHRILKDENVYKLIAGLCKQLVCVLSNDDFERAYDLVDCFHCLPDIIADNYFAVPNSFWKNYVKPYRNKWDKTFLRAEQKALKRGLW